MPRCLGRRWHRLGAAHHLVGGQPPAAGHGHGRVARALRWPAGEGEQGHAPRQHTPQLNRATEAAAEALATKQGRRLTKEELHAHVGVDELEIVQQFMRKAVRRRAA